MSSAELYGAIRASSDEGDFEKVVALARQGLKKQKKPDVNLVKSLLFGLAQDSQFEEAQKVLETYKSLSKSLVTEQAYVLYRLRRNDEAIALVESVPSKQRDVPLQHIEAQLAYRTGKFSKCVTIYEQELKGVQVDDPEMHTNVLAAYVSAGRPDQALTFVAGRGLNQKQVGNYEIAYNTACALIDDQDFKGAGEYLDKAETRCHEVLKEEGCDEEEIADESAIVRAQRAFVHQLDGSTDKATDLYESVLKEKPSDEAVSATCRNNIITLRSHDERLFDSLRKSEKSLSLLASNKLSQRQKRTVALNRCLLLTAGKRGNEAKTLLEEQAKAFAEGTAEGDSADGELYTLVSASLYYKEKQFDKCAEVLDAWCKDHPDNCLLSMITKAQIALMRGRMKEAAELLEAIKDPRVLHTPGMTATLAALYTRLRDHSKAGALLEAAVQHWTERQAQSSKQTKKAPESKSGASANDGAVLSADEVILRRRVLQEQAAEHHYRNGNLKTAAAHYRALSKLPNTLDEQKQLYLAQLVMVLSAADDPEVQKFAAMLSPDGDTSLNVPKKEVLALEKKGRIKGGGKPVSGAKQSSEKKAAPATETKDAGETPSATLKKRKKRRKRKKRLPKNFDPENPGPPPDPERWLPKWERTSFLKTRKGRQRRREQEAKALATGAQGTTVDESLDISNKAAPSVTASGRISQNIETMKTARKKGKKKGKR